MVALQGKEFLGVITSHGPSRRVLQVRATLKRHRVS